MSSAAPHLTIGALSLSPFMSPRAAARRVVSTILRKMLLIRNVCYLAQYFGPRFTDYLRTRHKLQVCVVRLSQPTAVGYMCPYTVYIHIDYFKQLTKYCILYKTIYCIKGLCTTFHIIYDFLYYVYIMQARTVQPKWIAVALRVCSQLTNWRLVNDLQRKVWLFLRRSGFAQMHEMHSPMSWQRISYIDRMHNVSLNSANVATVLRHKPIHAMDMQAYNQPL